jgi:hypothetical protein
MVMTTLTNLAPGYGELSKTTQRVMCFLHGPEHKDYWADYVKLGY